MEFTRVVLIHGRPTEILVVDAVACYECQLIYVDERPSCGHADDCQRWVELNEPKKSADRSIMRAKVRRELEKWLAS